MPIAATIQKELLSNDAAQFAMFLRAYKECSPEVQSIVDDMAQIISDEHAEADEKEHAIMVLLEALLPSFTTDIRECDQNLNTSDAAKRAIAELDQAEATFVEKLKRIMKDREMTQEDLARLTGVSQSAISNLLSRNCRPQRRTIERFAEALNVEPDDLWPET